VIRSRPGADQAPDVVEQAGEIRLARVESVRGVAAMLIIVAHLWGETHRTAASFWGTYWRRIVAGAGFSLWVFFALSGYLLFWPFVRSAFGDGGRLSLRQYALNRAIRILPLYYFAVVVLLIFEDGGDRFQLAWRHALFVQQAWRSSLGALDAPLWSVAVELQFYTLLPVLAALLLWLGRGSRWRVAASLVLLGVAAELARRWLAPTDNDLWGFQLVTTFQFFAAGMCLALLRHAWEERPPRVLEGPLGNSNLWALASLPLWALVIWHFDLEWLCAPASFLVIGALVLPLRPGVFSRVMELKLLAIVGIASYSVYVWHVPIIEALGGGRGLTGGTFLAVVAVLLPVCVIAGWLSFRLIEAPALRRRRQWAAGAAPKT